jgi:hypothetical protein
VKKYAFRLNQAKLMNAPILQPDSNMTQYSNNQLIDCSYHSSVLEPDFYLQNND